MASSFLLLAQKKPNQRKCAPDHKPSLNNNEGALVSRNLCGCSATAPALLYLRASCPNAELTNHKKHNSLRQPLQKAPHKSHLPQLAQWGKVSQKSK